MKKNKFALILAVILIVTCLAMALTACQEKDNTMTFIFKGLYEDSTQVMSITLKAKAGEEITPPTADEVEGKIFKGWYANESCEGDTVTPPTVMPNKDTTYYGIYVEKSAENTDITITFIANGQNVGTITQAAGTPITPPSAPNVENKEFKGWKFNNEGEPVMPSVMPSASGTYYAYYESAGGPQIPDDYNMAFNEKDGQNKLYLKGVSVYLEDGGNVLQSELSSDGKTAEFTIDETDYCAFIDYVNNTFVICPYAVEKEAYMLYQPVDDTFYFERMLYFDNEHSTFRLMGYAYETNWANGTFAAVDGSDNEFNITVTEDNTYGMFDDCRVKLIKRARQVEEEGMLAYSAYVVYDEAIEGEFRHYNNADITLSLDGYGFATYTDENGNISEGVCSLSDVEFGDNVYIDFTNTSTKETVLMTIQKGVPNLFAPIGDEIGLYGIFDITTSSLGDYYLIMDGWGNVGVVYFVDDIIEVSYGTYEKLENGEFEYTMTEIYNESLALDIYKTTFRFKLTTLTSGLEVINAYVVYNEELAGVMTNEAGTETLTLDGYNGGTHTKNGQSYNGSVSMLDDDILALFSSDDDFRIFRIIRGDEADKFVQIGNEYGTYFNYSYVTGYHDFYIRLNGEGVAQKFEFDESANNYVKVGQDGTYETTGTEDEYNVTLNGKTVKVALRLINFGSIYEEDWRYVYIEFDEAMFGSFANADHNEMLVLDGYGLEGVYTNASGQVFSGIFAREWNIVTLSTSDADGTALNLVFKLIDTTFELKPTVAGVYYNYLPSADLSTDSFRLLLDGDGNGLYDYYVKETDSQENVEGTYSYNSQTDEYTFTSTLGEFKFKLAVRNYYPVYILYNEDWKGEYINDYDYRLVLDGYGNVWYRDEDDQAICQVVGVNNNGVTFILNGESYAMVLNKANGTFERILDPLGYYYLYDFDTVNGRTRLCLGADGDAQIEIFSQEELAYIPSVTGTYAKFGTAEGVYKFTPASGEAFEFKIDDIAGYNVYRLKDGSEATLTCTATSVAEELEATLELNGFGDAKYSFYDREQDRRRTYEGYYTVDSQGNLTFIFVGSNGSIIYTYIMEVDFEHGTFEVVERVDGEL